ncbi:pyridoxal-phosphate dependent enzyme [Paenibacillus mesophilus]|uniref:threonine synthase n=1 Tax=Paenibacillus mesophilus TaxID=2582849 RepID=UPI00110DF34B|nr:pyridoxal-phosphate dependent enzyme [Paenibacillus mesophilus]TMV47310.1 pyridoxal-phosphate dependent enzyme [Paenibacillus mesophilus]
MEAYCWECGRTVYDNRLYACPDCGGTLMLRYGGVRPDTLKDDSQLGLWKYRRMLPDIPEANRLYLGEGATPLVPSRKIAKRLRVGELYFKLEGGNPTGSYKDRIAAVGVSWALANGRAACAGTTSGNAGAAFAAYAAGAGIPYHLFVLEHMAEAKLAQVLAYGAIVRKVKGFGTYAEVGDRVFARIVDAVREYDWESTITAFRYNPYAMEGVKTISYELAEQLSGPPTSVYSPAGGAGLYVGIWKGFDELKEIGAIPHKPHMVAVQSAGCSNIVRAYKECERVPSPGPSTSQISGLQVPNPPDGSVALGIMARGDGSAIAVDDEEIWEAQRMLAEEEGIFCEPAAATGLAGLIRAAKERGGLESERAVCIVSGVGFKDGKRLLEMVAHKSVPLLEADNLGI